MAIKNLNVKWYKGCTTDAAKQDMKLAIESSLRVLTKLKEILEDELAAEQREFKKATNYDKPRWEYFAADQLGVQRTLEEVIKLIPQEK